MTFHKCEQKSPDTPGKELIRGMENGIGSNQQANQWLGTQGHQYQQCDSHAETERRALPHNRSDGMKVSLPVAASYQNLRADTKAEGNGIDTDI